MMYVIRLALLRGSSHDDTSIQQVNSFETLSHSVSRPQSSRLHSVMQSVQRYRFGLTTRRPERVRTGAGCRICVLMAV
jgi:hypothetical protein